MEQSSRTFLRYKKRHIFMLKNIIFKTDKIIQKKRGMSMSVRILYVTGVTRRFQTTVPKTVREILNVTNDDDRIVWILENGEIKVKKA